MTQNEVQMTQNRGSGPPIFAGSLIPGEGLDPQILEIMVFDPPKWVFGPKFQVIWEK